MARVLAILVVWGLSNQLLAEEVEIDSTIGLIAANLDQEGNSGYSLADGYRDGKLLAEAKGTRGDFWAGFGSSVGLGLLGTGTLWLLTDGDNIPERLIPELRGKGERYEQGFRDAYKKNTKSIKRKSRLRGGLFGTATLFIILVSAN